MAMKRKELKKTPETQAFDHYLKVRGECYTLVWRQGPGYFESAIQCVLDGDWAGCADDLEHVLHLRKEAVRMFDERKEREGLENEEISGMCCRPLYDYTVAVSAIRHQLSHPPPKLESLFIVRCNWKVPHERVMPMTIGQRRDTLRECLGIYLSSGAIGVCDNVDLRQSLPFHGGGCYQQSFRYDPEEHKDVLTIQLSYPDGRGAVWIITPWGEVVARWALENLDQLCNPVASDRSLILARIESLSKHLQEDTMPWVPVELEHIRAVIQLDPIEKPFLIQGKAITRSLF